MLEQSWALYMGRLMVLTMASLRKLRSTDGKVFFSEEGFKKGLYSDKLIGTILVIVYIITSEPGFGTYLVHLYGSFDGLMMEILRAYIVDIHWGPFRVRCSALIKASILDILVVKCLALYLEM